MVEKTQSKELEEINREAREINANDAKGGLEQALAKMVNTWRSGLDKKDGHFKENKKEWDEVIEDSREKLKDYVGAGGTLEKLDVKSQSRLKFLMGDENFEKLNKMINEGNRPNRKELGKMLESEDGRLDQDYKNVHPKSMGEKVSDAAHVAAVTLLVAMLIALLLLMAVAIPLLVATHGAIMLTPKAFGLAIKSAIINDAMVALPYMEAVGEVAAIAAVAGLVGMGCVALSKGESKQSERTTSPIEAENDQVTYSVDEDRSSQATNVSGASAGEERQIADDRGNSAVNQRRRAGMTLTGAGELGVNSTAMSFETPKDIKFNNYSNSGTFIWSDPTSYGNTREKYLQYESPTSGAIVKVAVLPGIAENRGPKVVGIKVEGGSQEEQNAYLIQVVKHLKESGSINQIDRDSIIQKITGETPGNSSVPTAAVPQ